LISGDIPWAYIHPPGLLRWTKEYQVYGLEGLYAEKWGRDWDGDIEYKGSDPNVLKDSPIKYNALGVKNRIESTSSANFMNNYEIYNIKDIGYEGATYSHYRTKEPDVYHPNQYRIGYGINIEDYGVSIKNKVGKTISRDGIYYYYSGNVDNVLKLSVDFDKDQYLVIQLHVAKNRFENKFWCVNSEGEKGNYFQFAFQYKIFRYKYPIYTIFDDDNDKYTYSNIAVGAEIAENIYECRVKIPKKYTTATWSEPDCTGPDRRFIRICLKPVWLTYTYNRDLIKSPDDFKPGGKYIEPQLDQLPVHADDITVGAIVIDTNQYASSLIVKDGQDYDDYLNLMTDYINDNYGSDITTIINERHDVNDDGYDDLFVYNEFIDTVIEKFEFDKTDNQYVKSVLIVSDTVNNIIEIRDNIEKFDWGDVGDNWFTKDKIDTAGQVVKTFKDGLDHISDQFDITAKTSSWDISWIWTDYKAIRDTIDTLFSQQSWYNKIDSLYTNFQKVRDASDNMPDFITSKINIIKHKMLKCLNLEDFPDLPTDFENIKINKITGKTIDKQIVDDIDDLTGDFCNGKYEKILSKLELDIAVEGTNVIISGYNAYEAYQNGEYIECIGYILDTASDIFEVVNGGDTLFEISLSGKGVLGGKTIPVKIGSVASVVTGSVLAAHNLWKSSQTTDGIEKMKCYEEASSNVIDGVIGAIPVYGQVIMVTWGVATFMFSYFFPNRLADKVCKSPGSAFTFTGEYFFFDNVIPSAIAEEAIIEALDTLQEFVKNDIEIGKSSIAIEPE